MLKEIHEQPTALTQALEGRIDPENGRIALADFEPGTFTDIESVQLIACGTSYHAALYGSLVLNQAGVHATALLANEYSVSAPPIDDDTLVIAVTQSGETADTLNALRQANAEGATTVTVTNVVGSTAAREADEALFIRAGPEIGVAATKTFSSQAVMLTLLGQRIATDLRGEPPADLESLLPELAAMPDAIEGLLEDSNADVIADQYASSQSYFFIGRGLGFSVALEVP